MLGEVRCAMFGKTPWENVRSRTPADYSEASRAFTRAACLTESERSKRKLLVLSKRCAALATDTTSGDEQ